jgi:peptidoglycan hydrolase-like protein with peptidoglycan-binding domain
MTPDTVAALQAQLNAHAARLGYAPLVVDGRYGPKTDALYRAYLDALDPSTPSLAPPPERPWYASKLFLGGLAALAVSAFGLERVGLSSDLLGQGLDLVVNAALGLLALWGAWRGQAPLDRGAVLPGVRLPPRAYPTAPPPLGPPPGGVDLQPGADRLPVRPHRPPAPDADPRGVFRDY